MTLKLGKFLISDFFNIHSPVLLTELLFVYGNVRFIYENHIQNKLSKNQFPYDCHPRANLTDNKINM